MISDALSNFNALIIYQQYNLLQALAGKEELKQKKQRSCWWICTLVTMIASCKKMHHNNFLNTWCFYNEFILNSANLYYLKTKSAMVNRDFSAYINHLQWAQETHKIKCFKQTDNMPWYSLNEIDLFINENVLPRLACPGRRKCIRYKKFYIKSFFLSYDIVSFYHNDNFNKGLCFCERDSMYILLNNWGNSKYKQTGWHARQIIFNPKYMSLKV